jgi:hypothetical protein
VIDGEGRRILARVQPPQSHHGDLSDIVFAVRELTQ